MNKRHALERQKTVEFLKYALKNRDPRVSKAPSQNVSLSQIASSAKLGLMMGPSRASLSLSKRKNTVSYASNQSGSLLPRIRESDGKIMSDKKQPSKFRKRNQSIATNLYK